MDDQGRSGQVASQTPTGEGLARLRAEARLIHRHAAEYQRLLKKGDRILAVMALVRRHGAEYGSLVRDLRPRPQVQPARSSERAA